MRETVLEDNSMPVALFTWQEKSDLANSKNPDLPAYLNLSALCFFSISDHFFLSSFPVHLCY